MQNFDEIFENATVYFLKEYLKENDVNSLDIEKQSLLISATKNGDYNAVKFLAENGADLNFQDNDGYTPLHHAAQERHSLIAEFLVKSGADIEIRDEHGNPPIWYAIYYSGNDFIIPKMLHKAGADIETPNNYGNSPRNLGEKIYLKKFMEMLSK
jgi:ankyrin repeat protein